MRRFQESHSRIGLAVGVSLVFSVLVDISLREEAKNKVESICSTFLTNPVIEKAKITIENTDQVEGN